jgi:hypothetical protein
MTDLRPDIKARYKEGGNALRHYSNCVMNMRTVTIAQGIIILSAVIYSANQKSFVPSLWLCVFGLLFTVVLHILQEIYWKYFDTVLEAVSNIESRAKEDEKEGYEFSPWSLYKLRREERYQRRWWRYLARRGPFGFFLQHY